MNIFHHQSLRLGYSTVNAAKIKKLGLKKFIQSQLNSPVRKIELHIPDHFPKTFLEHNKYHNEVFRIPNGYDRYKSEMRIWFMGLKAYSLERCFREDSALKEKINLFFQNHFVATVSKVKVTYYISQYYNVINSNSLGNFKSFVKSIVRSNAMIWYLDNNKNRRNQLNENLARELLELFTLGIGNYTEEDIKEVGRSLAGLSFGMEQGEYIREYSDNSSKTIFGKTDNFKIDDVVDLIFEKQMPVATNLCKKLLSWFFYDDPVEELVNMYANKLIDFNFELKPFFEFFFFEECSKEKMGTKIKCPLTYILESHHNLGMEPNFYLIQYFLVRQNMDVFDQPSVKGWSGGRDWLTTHSFNLRKELIDIMTIKSRDFNFKKLKDSRIYRFEEFKTENYQFTPNLNLLKSKKPDDIKRELVCKTLFQISSTLKNDLSLIMPHDFDYKSDQFEAVKLRLYNYIAQTAEFQII